MNYHPWTHDDDEAFVQIDETPPEIEDKDFLLDEGRPASSWFPAEVVFDFSPVGGLKPVDSVPNTLGLYIVSEKLRSILESASGARFEFLPVKLRNHKRKLLSEPYFVANLLDVVACVDREHSEFRMNQLITHEIRRFKRLVLDTSKLGPDTKVFRLEERPDMFIIREDLAHTIIEAGCTGMVFMPMEDFGAEFRPKDNYDL
ncbi:hypothetical protein D7V97_37875 [Corallococcus sp. CA053C]|uniref:imm11 family protein n=1 Tax=Corallococcus sp. CA053C TaxID=2316732 RepID=UPI000EA29935|nr:DUF1629 domain-containing protein [Corallococcus sp. CA053C]RKG95068.1 hypothetical protein D7V97_37875 [Corallococcus sp. CA053C]